MIVAGKLHKHSGDDDDEPPPIMRVHRAYRDNCIEFAEVLGCQVDYVAHWFEQFTLMHMREQGMHKNLAAWVAWRNLQMFFGDCEEC